MLNGDSTLDAVSNSGPIMHLAQIGQFVLLDIFEKIYVPKSVYSEVTSFEMAGKENLEKSKNVIVVEVSRNYLNNIKENLRNVKLETGELEAIALCKQLNKNLFLTDDLSAREASAMLGLEVHGTIGIILKATKLNFITTAEAKASIKDLYEKSSLFLTKGLVNEAFKKIEDLEKLGQF